MLYRLPRPLFCQIISYSSEKPGRSEAGTIERSKSNISVANERSGMNYRMEYSFSLSNRTTEQRSDEQGK